MKKLAILALAGLILVAAAVPFATAREVNNQSDCNSNHVKCREYVFMLDEPWYKMAVMLTGCDVAFGKCMLSI